ncbi:MAG TPA: hypothetical protein VEZ48_01535 [Sphingomonadaceae bacterium]|nr:hypothetical protein [Sphingomonadaceae bacterium]
MWLIAAAPAHAQVTAEQVLAKARQLTAPPSCASADERDEIVVCGRRTSDGYRVPPSAEGGSPGDLRARVGELPSASPDRLAGGPCGIFAGERRCGKAEAKLYGYDSDKSPVSVLIDVGEALLDPE